MSLIVYLSARHTTPSLVEHASPTGFSALMARTKQTARKMPSKVPILKVVHVQQTASKKPSKVASPKVVREKPPKSPPLAPEPSAPEPNMDTWVATELPPEFACIHPRFQDVIFLSREWFAKVNKELTKKTRGMFTDQVEFQRFDAYANWAKGIHDHMNPRHSILATFPNEYTEIHKLFPAPFMSPKWKDMISAQKRRWPRGFFTTKKEWKHFEKYCEWAEGYNIVMKRREEHYKDPETKNTYFLLDEYPEERAIRKALEREEEKAIRKDLKHEEEEVICKAVKQAKIHLFKRRSQAKFSDSEEEEC